ncbi:unnamed protein product, partial [Porites evermanni]
FTANLCLLFTLERAWDGFEQDFQRPKFQDAAHPRIHCSEGVGVTIRGRRHLVFASDRQIEVLTKSKTWYISRTFPPATWSVYMEAVRTNNDLEGWHNALNRRGKGRAQLPLYILIQLLHKEAALVSLQTRVRQKTARTSV